MLLMIEFHINQYSKCFNHAWVKNEKDMAIIKIRGILVDMLIYIAYNVYGMYATMYWKVIK